MSRNILTEGSSVEQALVAPVKGNPFSRGLLNYFSHLRGFNHNIRCVMAGSFLMTLAFSFFNVLQNLYFQAEGYGEAFMGGILSTMSLGTVLFALPSSQLVDRVSFKKLLIGATLTLSTAGLFFLSSFNVYIIYPSIFIIGAVLSLQSVINAPFLMRNTSEKERMYAFSAVAAAQMLANLIGSFLAGNLGEYFTAMMKNSVNGYRSAMVAGLAISLAALIPYGLIRENMIRPEKPRGFNATLRSDNWPLILKLMLPMMLVGLGAGLVIPFLNVYFKSTFHVGADKVGIYMSLNFALMFIGIAAGPALASRFGIVKVMVASQLLSIPFFLTLAFTTNLTLAVIAFLMRAGLMNMSWPLGQNFNMEVVGQNEQATANSLIMFSWNIAWMLSVKFGGKLIEWAGGYTESMCLAAFIYIVSASFYYFFFHRAGFKEIGIRQKQ